MDYSDYQYKNICNKLQNRITVLESFLNSPEIKIFISESGLKQALMSGDRARLEKELLRQKARKEFKQEIARKGLPPSMERFDVLDPEVKRMGKVSFAQPYLNQFAAQSSIRDIGGNIEALAMQLDSEYPTEKRRIKVSDLPYESPFGTDRNPSFRMHVTPQQY
jgi:hypothetical protein